MPGRGSHYAREARRVLELREAEVDPTFRFATVTEVAGHRVKIRPTLAATAGVELIARVAGPIPQVGQRVLFAVIAGETVVLGALAADNDAAFEDVTVASLVAAGAITGASFNSPIPFFEAQTGADTASTTSTTVFQQAIVRNVVLPAGTWSVGAVTLIDCLHSADNRVQVCVEIDGVQGGANSPSAPSVSPNHRTVKGDHVQAGVAGGRTIAVKGMFRSLDAGTTTANHPALFGLAWRTA